MARFTIPRDVYFGQGTIEELKNIKAKKAIIITGVKSLKDNGSLEKIEANLKEAGIETKILGGMEPDPTIEKVMEGAKVMQEFGPDLIVGVGGGSPIDSAKAMWIFYEYPELSFEEVIVPFTLPELRKKARFVAISTTSGTGTEVTSFSVITDHKTGIKYPIADFNITPDIAIVDSDLVKSMPAELRAFTGMDALTHAVEAYVSTVKNEFTDALAMQSIDIIRDNLINSYKGNENAGSKMHLAQNLAGMSFSNAILGIVHSMAHKTGRTLNIEGGLPHGCANAIYLPFAIEFNKKVASKEYAKIARYLGLNGKTDCELTDSFVEMVRNLSKEMNIPATLKEFGIDEEVFMSKVDELAEAAVADPCTGTNPREISVEEMKKLFVCTYYGEKVDF
ncbi:MAG: iron-containing alcohol dehydrogenase [Clostridia bacterium]|jgi:alcohol dehydrogenase class IV|nr:iron-containing alcohol dehydrogenase [Clostridia bacterium]